MFLTMKDKEIKYTMPEIENCKKLFDDFMVKAKDFITKEGKKQAEEYREKLISLNTK